MRARCGPASSGTTAEEALDSVPRSPSAGNDQGDRLGVWRRGWAGVLARRARVGLAGLMAARGVSLLAMASVGTVSNRDVLTTGNRADCSASARTNNVICRSVSCRRARGVAQGNDQPDRHREYNKASAPRPIPTKRASWVVALGLAMAAAASNHKPNHGKAVAGRRLRRTGPAQSTAPWSR